MVADFGAPKVLECASAVALWLLPRAVRMGREPLPYAVFPGGTEKRHNTAALQNERLI